MFKESFDSRYNPNYETMLIRAKSQSRYILTATKSDVMRKIMIAAYELNMTNGEFVFLYPQSVRAPEASDLFWRQNDTLDEVAFKAFQCIIKLELFEFPAPDWGKLSFFTDLVMERSRKYYNYTYTKDEKDNDFMVSAYEAITILSQVLVENWPILESLDGKSFSNKISSRSFDLGFRTVSIGRNGMRTRNTIMSTLGSITRTFKIIWLHTWNTNVISNVSADVFDWYGQQRLPPDRPGCGFRNELCGSNGAPTIPVIVGSIFAACLGMLLFFVVYKRSPRKSNAEDMLWYIPVTSIDFQNAENLFKMSNLGDTKICMNVSFHESHQTGSLAQSSSVINYRGQLVWARKIHLAHAFSPSKQQELLIKKMKRIHSQSTAAFFGLCPLKMDMIVLCEIGQRGSLLDARKNESIRFDNSFKISFISDLTKGMAYLHRSHIHYHGSLSCQTCIVDSRFVLKVAYFRLDFLPRVLPEISDLTAYRYFILAPEQLRSPIATILCGSKEADVYSYGSVVMEIVSEAQPFQMEIEHDKLAPKEIIDNLRQQNVTPFRPKIPNNSCSPVLHKLIKDCWTEQPWRRPTFKHMETFLRVVPEFTAGSNFVESLFLRMARYAQELEDRIMLATVGIMEEKKKSDDLLFQVLPRHLVAALTRGIKVEAETFDAVTIAFTAIADFQVLTSESTPLQIVDLLNELFSVFDATLERFDVYKVETIFDSYMIASGIPIRNGHDHSRQIAKLSLELMNQSANFKTVHRPEDNLQLKIGFHQGPCAAGIVGKKMPRYCLFGDAINTASRMTSFGLAMKIQVSESAMKHLERFGDEFQFQYRDLIEIKGKGMQKCYWLLQGKDNAPTKKNGCR